MTWIDTPTQPYSKGSGSFAIALGGGGGGMLEGSASAVKRCGAAATEHGAYNISADVAGTFTLGGASFTLGKTSLSLRSEPTEGEAWWVYRSTRHLLVNSTIYYYYVSLNY